MAKKKVDSEEEAEITEKKEETPVEKSAPTPTPDSVPEKDEPAKDEPAKDEPAKDEKPEEEPKEKEPNKFSEFSKQAAEKTSQIVGKTCKKASEYDPRTAPGIIDRFVNWVRETFPPEMYDSISDWFTRHGHAGIVVAQILTVLYAFAAVILLEEGKGAEFASGIGMALILFVLQYISYKFLDAGKGLIESSPSRVGSTAFLDCSFLLLEIAGIMAVIYSWPGGWNSRFMGLGVWAICDAVAFTALHPSMVNIAVAEDVRAGEEAIGIMSFFAKAILRMVPIAFGVGAIMGACSLLAGFYALIVHKNTSPFHSTFFFITICLCLPFVSYVFFALYHLFIDVIRAILVLPEKLEK